MYSCILEVTACAKGEYTASFKSGKINEEDVNGRPVQVLSLEAQLLFKLDYRPSVRLYKTRIEVKVDTNTKYTFLFHPFIKAHLP